MTNQKDLLTAKETALTLGVHRHTLRKLTAKGIIPSCNLSSRIVRYRRVDIEAILNTSSQNQNMQKEHNDHD